MNITIAVGVSISVLAVLLVRNMYREFKNMEELNNKKK